MKKISRCDVVDEKGKIIIYGTEVRDLLRKDFKGLQTHVRIRYFKNFDDMMCDENEIYSIYPISQVYFFETVHE